MPTVLNAANEIAVGAFMAGQIGFFDIPRLVGEACEWSLSRDWKAPSSIEDALAIDTETRRWSAEQVTRAPRFDRGGGRRMA